MMRDPSEKLCAARTLDPKMSSSNPQVEADDGMMERLSKQIRCKNCRSNYIEEQNGDESCCYHPGPMKSYMDPPPPTHTDHNIRCCHSVFEESNGPPPSPLSKIWRHPTQTLLETCPVP